MSKPAQKRRSPPPLDSSAATKSALPTVAASASESGSEPKRSRVIAMLQSPGGATIAALIKETGWQQHSVRGFLSGVVRKRLKLKLNSKIVDGHRIYSVSGSEGPKPKVLRTKAGRR